MGKYLPDIRRGDTYCVKVRYPSGTDIAGYTHWLTLRDDIGIDPPALAVRSVVGDHASDDAAGGVAYLEAAADETAVLIAGRSYVYDVQVRTASGEIKTLLPLLQDAVDRISVIPDVTTDVV